MLLLCVNTKVVVCIQGDTTPGDITPGYIRPGDIRPGDIRSGGIRPGGIRPVIYTSIRRMLGTQQRGLEHSIRVEVMVHERSSAQ